MLDARYCPRQHERLRIDHPLCCLCRITFDVSCASTLVACEKQQEHYYTQVEVELVCAYLLGGYTHKRPLVEHNNLYSPLARTFHLPARLLCHGGPDGMLGIACLLKV